MLTNKYRKNLKISKKLIIKLFSNITNINLASKLNVTLDKSEVGKKTVFFDFQSTTPLDPRVLDEMHNTLQNKKSVLVHCHQGIQRSCAITACYLVKYHNMTPNRAIEYIKSKRNVAFYYGANFKKTIDTVYNDKMNRYY